MYAIHTVDPLAGRSRIAQQAGLENKLFEISEKVEGDPRNDKKSVQNRKDLAISK